MTMKFLAAAAAIGLAAASPALGRSVELLAFDAHPVESVPSTEATADPRATDLSSALAADFRGMGDHSAPAAEKAGSSTIAVPLWMRTGVARAGSAYLGSAMPLAAGACGLAAYRPRAGLPTATEARRASLYPLIAQIACETGVPIGLFDALVGQESRYRMDALSPKGAIGLTQLMPGTARDLGVRNPWHPVENLRGGARYLRRQLDEFGRADLALAAYNAGPQRVRGRLRVPVIAETLNYVLAVTRAWHAAAAPQVLSNRLVRQP